MPTETQKLRGRPVTHEEARTAVNCLQRGWGDYTDESIVMDYILEQEEVRQTLRAILTRATAPCQVYDVKHTAVHPSDNSRAS